MQLNITGYSTALFSTWFFVDELGLLLDAGDGVSSSLLQKARKIKHAFISHADRDHLTGLLQFNQLNAREGYPIIYYPKDCGSFPALENFSKQFDLHVGLSKWKPIQELQEFEIKPNIFVKALRNNHVVSSVDKSKSLSYKVYQQKRKLKSEFLGLSGNEIKQLIAEKGREFTTTEVRTNLLSYSGDTPVGPYETWDHSEILIHEATFLGGKDDAHISPHGNKHSTLQEVMQMVSKITIGKLILSHFSSRYSQEMIDEKIRFYCKEYAIDIPVFRILPGKVSKNILATDPIN